MNFNIWTAKISVAFKIIVVFFIHVHKQYVAKSIATCKKKSLLYQPKPFFSPKIIVKSFLDRF